MVIAYELFSTEYPGGDSKLDYATSAEMSTMYEHLKESLAKLGFRQWNEGDNYMRSLRRVFSRTQLERRDTAAIHKLCGEIDKYTARVRDEFKNKYLQKDNDE
jgi:tRNA C32,U32 (ribose-2'-O)-methylase TrmJ